jgi:anti-sigma B factor antagonist
MKTMERERDGVKILSFEGPLTIGAGDLALRDAISEALDEGARNLLVDLSRASKIDSSGIGELLAAYTRATNRGCKLKLLHLSAKLKDLLTITQLIKVFDIFEDEKEAVASFR